MYERNIWFWFQESTWDTLLFNELRTSTFFGSEISLSGRLQQGTKVRVTEMSFVEAQWPHVGYV
jgi:hypothetical protein